MTVNFAAALVGGLVTILSPCGALLLPAFFAYAFNSRGALASRTAIFFAGLLVVLVPLGAAMGTLSSAIVTHRGLISAIAGVIVIGLGIVELFNLPLPGAGLLNRAKTKAEIAGSRTKGGRTSGLAMLALGIGYGIAGAGCTGPILGAVLLVAATSGAPLLGAATMAFYALGMVIPVILLALLWQAAGVQQRLKPRPMHVLGRQTTLGSVISGVVLILLGIWLLVTGGAALGGVLSAGQQANLESGIMGALAGIPNAAVIALLVALGAAIALVVLLWRRHDHRESPEQ